MRSGCGAAEQVTTLCSPEPVSLETTSCGVRLEDDTIFYLDAPYEAAKYIVPNPFAHWSGFRRCTQQEIDASDCRDFNDVPPRRSVRFDVSNDTAGYVWLIVSANSCSALGIEGVADGAPLVLERHGACVSECGSARDVIQTFSLRRLAPGAAISLPWDGRAIHVVPTIVRCEEEVEALDSRCATGRSEPVAAGRYAVKFSRLDEPTPYLVNNDCIGQETCEVTDDVVGVPSLKEFCWPSSTSLIEVEFDLPAAGEVIVPIRLE